MATNDRHGENSPYFDGWKAYDNDPFHPTQNPEGMIQMGLAENQLSVNLIEEWIKNNPEASICTTEGLSKFKEIANFQDYHGLPEFRNGVAKFMSKVRGGRVQFDPGDPFLIPSPYSLAFDCDLCWRTGVKLVPVHCDSSNNFKITRKRLGSCIRQSQRRQHQRKGFDTRKPIITFGNDI